MAVMKALRSNPDLLAQASGIMRMAQLHLQSKEQILYIIWRFCQLNPIYRTDFTS